MNDTYKFEKESLKEFIANPDIVALFKEAKCFIAGGAITSIFSNTPINDIDVYFRDYKSLKFVLTNLFNVDDEDECDLLDVAQFSLIYTGRTSKSVLFTKDGVKIQLIYFRFFDSAEDIFNTFDFTVNMGAYDCAEDRFVLHENFLRDVAKRIIRVNTKTSFPIISLLRIDKYKQKGYTISRKEFVKLCLAVNMLSLKTWEELANAIGGMYGYNYDSLFDTTKEFSVEEALTQLTNLESNLEKFVATSGITYYELIEAIEILLQIIPKKSLKTFYKKVLKTDVEGVYSSYYQRNFSYPMGQVVNGGPLGLWAYKTIKAASKHFTTTNTKEKEAIIELEIESTSDALRDYNSSYKLMGNVKVIREVEPIKS